MVTRPKVLYADADAGNLALFQRGFGDRFEVSGVRTQAEAIDLLGELEFAVVVAERADLLGEARRCQPDVVTVIVTAHPTFEGAVEAINRGQVVGYLKKPWSAVEMLQALHTGVDLFEKRRENRLLRERLIREERNVVIGQLASGLVHELANIGAVLAVIENVREDWGKGLDLTEELSTLRSGVDKYWALVGSLKFCGSGHDAVQLKPAVQDLSDVIRDAADLAAHFPAVRLLNRFEIEPSPPTPANVDATALFHALLNLMKNAAEACPPRRGEVYVRLLDSPESVRIEVRDTGPGVPDELAPRILEGFYSTKGSSGTGLGLLVTRRIVEGHGGRLAFHNLPAGGCVFSIELPRNPSGEL